MKMTNLYLVLAGAALLTAVTASAQPLRPVQRTDVKEATVCGLSVTDVKIRHDERLMSVDLNLQLSALDLHGDRVAVFSPVLVNGTDTLVLAPVGLYSRIRYIQYLRNDRQPAGGPGETSYRFTDRPGSMAYSQTFPYADWMNGATLYLQRSDYGCCHELLDEQLAPMAAWREVSYEPAYHFVTPTAERVKLRELSGKAYIDFPVNKTELYPDYRKNPTELAKIVATIDSVRNDRDVTVKRITIKGWASPESSWENNTRLAKGRTATLKQYVQNLYKFPEGFIETDYCPEDWIGLRAFVESSNLPHRDEILALIDDPTLDPDPKERRLKTTYPDEYKFLLATVYPGLRHSDYTIEYTVRQYNDPEEIRQVMARAPQNLSLEEFFVLARAAEAGSEEYSEVFETAVRMYPLDETANLNAATAAMQRGDMTAAERYLAKAGESDAAVYARGVYAALKGDFDTAATLFRQVADRLPEAAGALTCIEELTNPNNE